MAVFQVLVVQRTVSSTVEEACDKFDDLSEKLERFKGMHSINCLLIMKFQTRAYGIIFHRAVVFLTITYSKFHTLSSSFFFFYMNLFLIYVGLNITRKFIPKVFLDFIDDLKEHRDIGVIDVEIHVDNEFKDHPSLMNRKKI